MNGTSGYRRIVAATMFAFGLVAQSNAAIITYTDRTAFGAATSGVTTIDFEAQNTAGSFTFYGSGLNVAGVQFSAPLSSYLYVADPAAVNTAYQWGSGASLLFGSTNEGGNLVIQLGAGVFSFGFDYMAQADQAPDATGGLIYNIDVDGNAYSGTTANRPNREFFGITSDTAISQITLTMTNTNTFRALPIIDNVSFGNVASTVPEPGVLVLLGLGLAGLAAARRHR